QSRVLGTYETSEFLLLSWCQQLLSIEKMPVNRAQNKGLVIWTQSLEKVHGDPNGIPARSSHGPSVFHQRDSFRRTERVLCEMNQGIQILLVFIQNAVIALCIVVGEIPGRAAIDLLLLGLFR